MNGQNLEWNHASFSVVDVNNQRYTRLAFASAMLFLNIVGLLIFQSAK